MSVIAPESLRDFLALSYSELEAKNLEYKQMKASGTSPAAIQKKVLKYLETEKRIKAITLAFCDLEGRLHLLDYDKNFFLGAYENLTFDGSSITGFTELNKSDLRLSPDWGSFRLLPADIFGPGKVLMFGFVQNQDGTQYEGDFRGRLANFTEELRKKKGYTILTAPELEGFLVEGVDAEQNFQSGKGFQIVTRGGYFSALPQDSLRKFIDSVAEVQRALGFENEKDHGEVGPSQFEINFKYAEVCITCDQILLYKLAARQVAKLMGYTATFLPKPMVGINGSGMHTNMSIAKGGKNLFYSKKSKDHISEHAEKFIAGILYYANELCLTICPSVNSYRRLDPNFEAPNEIKYSASDRGSMVRIPIGNERSARIEVRSVSPDCNPYLASFSLILAGLTGMEANQKELKEMEGANTKKPIKKLWGIIGDALHAFQKSEFMKECMGKQQHKKYLDIKTETANRSPRELGTKVKTGEIIYHHEVTNQVLWNQF